MKTIIIIVLVALCTCSGCSYLPNLEEVAPSVKAFAEEKYNSITEHSSSLNIEGNQVSFQFGSILEYSANKISVEIEFTNSANQVYAANLQIDGVDCLARKLDFRNCNTVTDFITIKGILANEIIEYISKDYYKAKEKIYDFNQERENLEWDVFVRRKQMPSLQEIRKIEQKAKELNEQLQKEKNDILDKEIPIHLLKNHITLIIEEVNL